MGGWVENDLRSAHSLISRETKKNETGSSPPHPTGVEQLIAEQPSMPSGNKNVGQVERIVKLPQRRTLTKQVFREKKHSGHVPPRAACAEDSSQTGNAANGNRRKIRKKNVWLGCDGSEGGNVGGSGEGLVPPAPQFVKQWTPVMTSTSVTKVIA